MTVIKENETVAISVTVDGRDHTMTVESRTSLADALRDQAQATSIKIGCEEGVCGACTIKMDGVIRRSCLTLAVQAEGSVVTTAAALGPAYDDLKTALKENFAFQCGYCAAGLMVALASYLDTYPKADREDIQDRLAGHICRCTGYYGMVRAVLQTLEARSKQHPTP